MSYALNELIFLDGAFGETGSLYSSLSLADVPDTAQTIELTETRHFYALGPEFWRWVDNGPGLFNQHLHRINFSFLDGHAKSLKAIQTLIPKSLWASNRRLDELAAYPDFSPARYPRDPVSPKSYWIIDIAQEYR
jgi:prepilin-type processing-associated H-X9-DG protein